MADSQRSVRQQATEAFRQFQDLVSDIQSSLQERVETAAGRTPLPSGVSNKVAEYIERSASVSDAWARPLRDLLDEQKRMAEQMAALAEQQRLLAEQLGAWSERLARMTEQASAAAEPILEQSDRYNELTKSMANAFRRPATGSPQS